MTVKKIISLIVRIAVVGGCLVYALWDVEFRKLGEAFVQFDPLAIVVTTALTFLGYQAMAVRMNFLSGYDCGNWVGFKAYLLSMAVNNVAPAKLGELAKAFYMRSQCGYSLSRSISMVFWERFFDLNALLAMGIVVAIRFKLKTLFFPLALGVGAVWVCLFVIRKWPEKTQKLVSFIPFERLRNFILDVKLQLVHGVTLKYLFILGAYTAVVWAFYALTTFLAVHWIAGLDLKMGQTLAVFVISALGMAVPSSPGAVIVFETAVAFGLGLFGVDKELGLAIGFLIHMIQYIPTTITGLVVLAKSGLSLQRIRTSDEEMEA